MARVVLQQQREAQPRAAVLRIDKLPFVIQPRPVPAKLI
jgi:hypothetical protein